MIVIYPSALVLYNYINISSRNNYLIKKNDSWVFQYGSGYGHSLFFAAAQF